MISKVVRKNSLEIEAAPFGAATPHAALRIEHVADDGAGHRSPGAPGEQKTNQCPEKNAIPTHSR